MLNVLCFTRKRMQITQIAFLNLSVVISQKPRPFKIDIFVSERSENCIPNLKCSCLMFSTWVQFSFFKKVANKIACQYNDSRAEVFGNKAKELESRKNSAMLKNESYDPIRPLSRHALFSCNQRYEGGRQFISASCKMKA